MLEPAREALAGEEAWIVGGAVRDELLGRPVVDLDVACRAPEAAARAHARIVGGAPFPLSERHGAWRVVLEDGRTVDFTLLAATIDEDLGSRDFSLNAIAVRLADGLRYDPLGGVEDLEAGTIRAVSEGVFRTDPLRLLRAVRLEDELGFALDAAAEELVRRDADLVSQPAGERILAELLRLSERGYRRLEELGLLERLGGSLAGIGKRRLDGDPRLLLIAAFGNHVGSFPVSNELRGLARAVLGAERPDDESARSIHRFRRRTEPWAIEALRFVGAAELEPAVERARREEPQAPLLRGDELGLPPGPEIGRLLDRIAEERAAGTIATREDALELARREARA
jgi:hypothetical protein